MTSDKLNTSPIRTEYLGLAKNGNFMVFKTLDEAFKLQETKWVVLKETLTETESDSWGNITRTYYYANVNKSGLEEPIIIGNYKCYLLEGIYVTTNRIQNTVKCKIYDLEGVLIDKTFNSRNPFEEMISFMNELNGYQNWYQYIIDTQNIEMSNKIKELEEKITQLEKKLAQ